MKKIKTVFNIGTQNYTVTGAGQQAVSTILKKFPKQVVILKGFLIQENDQETFLPVNLS